jgi:hypothetical protein
MLFDAANYPQEAKEWHRHIKYHRDEAFEKGVWMIPQWPSDRPLPEPYTHLEQLRKATA